MNLKNVSKETWIRTATLLLALINQALVMFGKEILPFTVDEVYEVGTVVFTLFASVWSWWKNQSFTEEAQIADEVMKELKAERKAEKGIIEEEEQIEDVNIELE